MSKDWLGQELRITTRDACVFVGHLSALEADGSAVLETVTQTIQDGPTDAISTVRRPHIYIKGEDISMVETRK
ncbi:hypothetical protein GMRT_12525 [Giardia muris]|uniref:Sm domain-containing protein n=1 Tax=Giardia muris TaxID=5742 RepID=A0A4Z1T370_GIAMU|nr:hypothetical protein GMRT_12525 [Giardia muris]|eukprot:TNJ28393.1 hypothetical protein GMRT_12525 [Giardia muris]